MLDADTGGKRVDDWRTEMERRHEASFGWALVHCQGDALLARAGLEEAYREVERAPDERGEQPFEDFLRGLIRRVVTRRDRERGDDAERSSSPAHQLLAKLPRAHVLVLYLRFGMGFSDDELQRALGASAQRVRASLEAARPAAARTLGLDDDDEALGAWFSKLRAADVEATPPFAEVRDAGSHALAAERRAPWGWLLLGLAAVGVLALWKWSPW